MVCLHMKFYAVCYVKKDKFDRKFTSVIYNQRHINLLESLAEVVENVFQR